MSPTFPREMPKRRKPPAIDAPRKVHTELPDTLPPVEPMPELYNHQFMDIAGRKQHLTTIDQANFCTELAKHGNKSRAALAIGHTPATIHRYQNDYKQFADGIQLAMEAFAGDVEAELIRRAVHGIDDVKLDNKGNIALTVKKFSDRLLELLTKRHHPEYGDRSTLDVNVKGGLLVLNAETDTPDEWKNRHNQPEPKRSQDAIDTPAPIDVESSEVQ